jgi:hypothetical protein
MKYLLVMSVAGLATISGAFSASCQTREVVIVFPQFVLPNSVIRQPAAGTIRSIDGVRNGTTKEERDLRGGPGDIYLPGWPWVRAR